MSKNSFVVLKISAAVMILFIVSQGSAGEMQIHLSRLSQLQGQISSAERDIEVLLDEKKHAHDQKELHQIVTALTERHKELSKSSKNYEELRQHIRFEHPDKNADLERQYIRHKLKSIAEFENGIGLDSRLDRIKARALAIFPLPERPPRPPSVIFGLRNPASQVEDEDAPEQIHLKK